MTIRTGSASLRDFLRQAEAQGWVASHTRGGHVALRHSCGATVFLPKTPSDHRSLKNCAAQMRRLLREKGQ